MDWEAIRGGARRETVPRLHLIEVCWRMRGRAGRVVTCGIYRIDGPGLEVRAGFSDDDLLRSQRAAEIGSARELAEAWRQAVLLKGGFVEVSAPPKV